MVATEVSELDKLHIKLAKLINDFDALVDRALAELPAWPRTQYEQSPGIHLRRRGQSGDRSEPPRQPPSSQESQPQ
jgi:hypothetical protein